jgi:hypothetical protein
MESSFQIYSGVQTFGFHSWSLSVAQNGFHFLELHRRLPRFFLLNSGVGSLYIPYLRIESQNAQSPFE